MFVVNSSKSPNYLLYQIPANCLLTLDSHLQQSIQQCSYQLPEISHSFPVMKHKPCLKITTVFLSHTLQTTRHPEQRCKQKHRLRLPPTLTILTLSQQTASDAGFPSACPADTDCPRPRRGPACSRGAGQSEFSCRCRTAGWARTWAGPRPAPPTARPPATGDSAAGGTAVPWPGCSPVNMMASQRLMTKFFLTSLFLAEQEWLMNTAEISISTHKTIKAILLKVWTANKKKNTHGGGWACWRGAHGKFEKTCSIFLSIVVELCTKFSPCCLHPQAQSRWLHTGCRCWGWTWPPGVLCSWGWLLHCLHSGMTAIRQRLPKGHTTGRKSAYGQSSHCHSWGDHHHMAHSWNDSLYSHCHSWRGSLHTVIHKVTVFTLPFMRRQSSYSPFMRW